MFKNLFTLAVVCAMSITQAVNIETKTQTKAVEGVEELPPSFLSPYQPLPCEYC